MVRVWWSERSCSGGRIWLEFPSKESLGCGDWFKVRFKRSEKGRKHQGCTPRRLPNGCFIHPGDLYHVYLLFSEITVNRGGRQALGLGGYWIGGYLSRCGLAGCPGSQRRRWHWPSGWHQEHQWAYGPCPQKELKQEHQAFSPEQETQRRGGGSVP